MGEARSRGYGGGASTWFIMLGSPPAPGFPDIMGATTRPVALGRSVANPGNICLAAWRAATKGGGDRRPATMGQNECYGKGFGCLPNRLCDLGRRRGSRRRRGPRRSQAANKRGRERWDQRTRRCWRFLSAVRGSEQRRTLFEDGCDGCQPQDGRGKRETRQERPRRPHAPSWGRTASSRAACRGLVIVGVDRERSGDLAVVAKLRPNPPCGRIRHI